MSAIVLPEGVEAPPTRDPFVELAVRLVNLIIWAPSEKTIVSACVVSIATPRRFRARSDSPASSAPIGAGDAPARSGTSPRRRRKHKRR